MRSVTWCGAVAIVLFGCSSGSDQPSGSGQAQAGAASSGGNTAQAGSSSAAGNNNQAGNAPAAGGGNAAQAGSSNMSMSGSANGGAGGNASGGTAGDGGSTSTCGTATQLQPPMLTACPTPGATEPEVALGAVNDLRAHMGLSCMTLVAEINTSAQKHCDYYQQNKGDQMCIANAHEEVETCPGYVDAQFFNRMTKAGYKGSPRSEVMAFSGDPASAIAQWINSVYHRTPLLSPWLGEMGYGMTADCDTIDMGAGPKVADDVTAVYPYPGQTGVPTSFDGSHEGPTPPAPPGTPPTGGWPSASPIHVYAKNYTVTSHDVYAGQDCTTLPHQWLPDKEQYILYPNRPFAKATSYRVVIKGTRGGKELDFDWTFTTKN